MVITPVELETRQFGKALRGYNIDEVDGFIQRMSRDYEALYQENQELKDQCDSVRQELRRYRNLEDSINETLLIAQKAAEDTRTNAFKEAELIIKEAKTKAEGMVAEVTGEVLRKQAEVQELYKQQEVFSAEFKLLLMTHLELLERKMPSAKQEAAAEQQKDPEDEEEPEFM